MDQTLWIPFISGTTTSFELFQKTNSLPETTIGSAYFVRHAGHTAETMCALYTVPLVKLVERPVQVVYVEVIPTGVEKDGYREYTLTEVYVLLQVEADTSFRILKRGTALLVSQAAYTTACQAAYQEVNQQRLEMQNGN